MLSASNPDAAEYRFLYDADPKCTDEQGNTPLHLACENGHTAIVRLLVQEKGCDINCQANDGSTPLHRACSSGGIDIIKFLLQQKCDTRIQNNGGQSPQTIPLNEDGDLLLHIGCQSGDMDIIKYLISYQRCNTMLQNKKGQSPQSLPINVNGDLLLHVACQWGDVGIVRYLVCEQHCDVDVWNNNSDSPLSIACYCKSLDIIKFLLQQKCDTRVHNKKGQSPQTIPLNEDGDLLLHIACQWGDVGIVRYLVCDQYCDVNVWNNNSDSPLSIACYCKSLDIIKFLLQQKCDTMVHNKKGQSPQTIPLNEDGDLLLHIACQWGDIDNVTYLVCEQHCDVNVRNKNVDSPLSIACYYKHFDIINFLLHQRCDTRVQNNGGQSPQTIPLNEDGDLLLHIACQWRNDGILYYLIHKQRCDTRVQNKKGQIPQTLLLNENGDVLLHIVCTWGDLDIVKNLIRQQHCDINVCNSNGDTLLHVSCQGENLDILKYLITEHHCDVNVRNMNKDSLLHVACQGKSLSIVKYLITEQNSDVNTLNSRKSAPLHVAIVSCQPSTALYLLRLKKCDPTLRDSDGNTPLHLACRECTKVDQDSEMIQVARMLLSSTDLSACVNNVGQTPVELTTNYQLIKYISHITKCMTNHSIQTFIKMFFIGNPSTGKSTLVKAICCEKSWLWTLVPRWFSRVRNVPLRTAGIVPVTFRSKTFDNTVLYDMAGQYEYYTSHAAVIENTVLSSPPAFVVVVNLSESDAKIVEKLKYWWSFIDNHAARSIVSPHVILIGSHADVVKASGISVQEKMDFISSVLRGLSSSFHFAGQVALDCRDPISSGLGQFCSLVEKSCTTLRQTADIDLRCHVAYSFLLEMFEGRVACTLSDIAAKISGTDTLLPQNPDELVHLMSSLSDKGLVLLVKTSGCIEESWVILQKQDLLSEFNGTMFAPENFKQHREFARSTGVVPFSHIKGEFPLYDSAMIAGFLTHLEFCFKIDDPETIKRIEDEAPKDETRLDPTDEYYFFPALVSVDNPLRVWQTDDSMVYQCGWYYKCHADQFLSTRFLHVLILRLAFSFALGLDKQSPSQNAPVLCRRCSVWKHGIGWLQDGIEIVVEVGLQCQWVTVMMRCFKGKEVKCVQLRSAVVREVKKACTQLCKAVRMTESLIGPPDVHYPFSDEHVSLYSVTDIANAIATEETHVIDQQGHNFVPIQDLVIFEPYLGVGPNLLDELFHHNNSDKLVSKSFLEHLASRVHPQMSLFEKVVDPQPAIHYQKELEKESLPASKCLVLLKWLLRKLENPTYENFHKELDKYSIFCGRNPMVSEHSPRLPMRL